MTTIAKFLIAALGAAAITANTVSAAHGWGHVNWVPIGEVWGTAVAVWLYPNQPAVTLPANG